MATAPATDQQIQAFVDQRLRPHADLARSLVISLLDDIAAINGVYANLNAPNPTWTDTNTGAVYSLTPADVLAFNAFMHDVSAFMTSHSAYPVVEAACLTPPVKILRL